MEKAQGKQLDVAYNTKVDMKGDSSNLQFPDTVQEAKDTKPPENFQCISKQSTGTPLGKHKRWLQMSFYAILVLAGQSAATLLGRLYYANGGKSKWMATLVQTAGFPILIPFLFGTKNKNHVSDEQRKQPSALVLGSICVVLGILLAGVCLLFALGLLYLPVSTFSLLSATQLGFNAFFSFFLNSQKFTPYIINSVVLLTTCSVLLVFQTESSGTAESSKGKYIAGFICTLCGAAGYSLLLCLTQLVLTKILKRQTVKELLDLIIYQSLVGSCVIVIGLFASGEWKTLMTDMKEFQLGKVSYTMTLIWTTLSWQIFTIGMLGLILKASALFANVISTLGLPTVPILAVIIFKEKMSGIKAVAMLLAIWGFISYIYQHYLDDLKSKPATENVNKVTEISVNARD